MVCSNSTDMCSPSSSIEQQPPRAAEALSHDRLRWSTTSTGTSYFLHFSSAVLNEFDGYSSGSVYCCVCVASVFYCFS